MTRRNLMIRTAVLETLDARRLMHADHEIPSGEPDPVPEGTGQISGYVVNDVNADGKWNNAEKGIAGREVWLDVDNDGTIDDVEPFLYTASNGKYVFTGLGASTYTVREVVPEGWTQTNPKSSGAFTVFLKDGQAIAGKDFSVVAGESPTPTPTPTPSPSPTPTPTPTPTGTATFSGYVVNDTNKDGLWSDGETGIAGRTVYIDTNNNGAFDTGEDTRTTASNGKYIFANIAAGQFVVRQVLPAGWVQSKPVANAAFVVKIADGQTQAGKDFATYSNGATTPTPTPTPTTPTPTPTTPTPTPSTTKVTNWITKASLPQARSEIFGESVGGKLYTFGGYYDASFRPTNAANVYDPKTNAWNSIKSLPVGITHVAHAADNRYIYFAGGYPATGAASPGPYQTYATSAVRAYDTQTNNYTSLPSLPSARGAGALAMEGRTLYFWAGNDANRVDRTEGWKIDLDNQAAGWKSIAATPVKRNHTAAVGLDGFVYLFGGQIDQDADATWFGDLYRYDPAANDWDKLASNATPRSHITSSFLVYEGKLLSVGGEKAHNTPITNVDLYNPATNSWSRIGSMPDVGRYSGVAGLLDAHTLIYAGGYTTYFRNTVWTATID